MIGMLDIAVKRDNFNDKDLDSSRHGAVNFNHDKTRSKSRLELFLSV